MKINLNENMSREEMMEARDKAQDSCENFRDPDNQQDFDAYVYWAGRISYWTGRIKEHDLWTGRMKEHDLEQKRRERDLKIEEVKATDIYSKTQLTCFRQLCGRLVMDLVNRSMVIKDIRTMDTMSIINLEVPGLRRGSIHFHPDNRISSISGWKHIRLDPEQTDDPIWCGYVQAYLEDQGWIVDADAIR